MAEKIDVIFFIGPQGSGKGTQARKLSEKLGFFYWEMGGIIREVSQEQSELGLKVKELQDQGVLLPDELLLELFKSRMNSLPKNTGVIFDGIPRRVGQARFVLDFLHSCGLTNFITLFLDLPQEESLTRLLKRAELEKRVDDTAEKIKFRLEQYYSNTVPMLEIMRNETKFVSIDGKPSVDEVTSQINKILNLN